MPPVRRRAPQTPPVWVLNVHVGEFYLTGRRPSKEVKDKIAGVDYPFELEKHFENAEKEGKLKRLDRQRFDVYSDNFPGVFFVWEVL